MHAGVLALMIGIVMKTGLPSRLALVLLLVAISDLGATSSVASGATGAKISAHLTKTSFTASQAGSVKLVYRFSKPSRRFSYVLTFTTGSRWQTVKGVKKKGSFKGSHTMTVTKLFAGKPVKVGRYRLKLSADGGSLLLSFRVTKAGTTPTGGGGTTPPGSAPGAFNKTSPANGATGQPSTPSLNWGTSSNAASYEYCIDTTNNNACDGSWVSTNAATSASLSGLKLSTTYYWQVHAINAQGTTNADGGSWASFTVSGPQAGSWVATASSLSGPVSGSGGAGSVKATSVYFNVLSDQATVASFGFGFEYSGIYNPKGSGGCSGSGSSAINAQTTSPIVNGQFSSPSITGPWTGGGAPFLPTSRETLMPALLPSPQGRERSTRRCWSQGTMEPTAA
jgi:hypothetical protein